jgi:hypothetical protein
LCFHIVVKIQFKRFLEIPVSMPLWRIWFVVHDKAISYEDYRAFLPFCQLNLFGEKLVANFFRNSGIRRSIFS